MSKVGTEPFWKHDDIKNRSDYERLIRAMEDESGPPPNLWHTIVFSIVLTAVVFIFLIYLAFLFGVFTSP